MALKSSGDIFSSAKRQLLKKFPDISVEWVKVRSSSLRTKYFGSFFAPSIFSHLFLIFALSLYSIYSENKYKTEQNAN